MKSQEGCSLTFLEYCNAHAHAIATRRRTSPRRALAAGRGEARQLIARSVGGPYGQLHAQLSERGKERIVYNMNNQG